MSIGVRVILASVLGLVTPIVTLLVVLHPIMPKSVKATMLFSVVVVFSALLTLLVVTA